MRKRRERRLALSAAAVLIFEIVVLAVLCVKRECTEREPDVTPMPTHILPASLGDDETEAVNAERNRCRATADEIELIARTIWGEAELVQSTTERAAVAWCILNRVDNRGESITVTITSAVQFQGFWRFENSSVPAEYMELATDVCWRWTQEHKGQKNVGRVLPKEYEFFMGDMQAHNYFTTEFMGDDYWDWAMESPYID